MNKKEYLINLLKQQVQPALGCTEIGIVSLAAAKAGQLLPGKLVRATVSVSPYVYRNDGRVGVPNLGRCGIRVIAAAGLILKNPEKKLNCLDDLTPKTIALAKRIGSNTHIIDENVDYRSPVVYAKVFATDNEGNKAEVIIKDMHDNIVSAKLNGVETIKKNRKTNATNAEDIDFDKLVDALTIKDVYLLCKKLTIKDLGFLQEGIDLNKKIRIQGFEHPKKEWLSNKWKKMMQKSSSSFGFYTDAWVTKLLGQLCAAVDARMYGCPLPVMSSARSGDHGLTVTIPQNIHAGMFKISQRKLLQAVAFAHYITWKIKSKVGHLCGMCGSALAAGAATTCGIAFQRNWSWQKIQDLLNLHLVSQAGIVCDGAKPSCSFKIMSSLVCGFLCLSIVEAGGKIDHKDGIVNKDVEKTINNLRDYSKATRETCVSSMVDIMAAASKEK